MKQRHWCSLPPCLLAFPCQHPCLLLVCNQQACYVLLSFPQGVSPAEAEELKKLYRHPVFNMDDEEHDRLIADSAAVDAALNGGELKIKDDLQRIDSEAF